MKRLALVLCILGAVAAAQTTTTITGTLKDLTNTAVTSGKVTFTLQPSKDTTISGVARFTPQTVTCLVNGSGLIKAQDGVSTCTVTMNTALQPTGTYYRVDVWPYNVKTSSFTFYAVLSTYDWSTVVPTPTTSPAANFVDIFSNQTIGGNKTFSGTSTFTAPATFSGGTTTFGAIIATALNLTTIYATAGETVAHAVSRLPVGGGKVIFDCGVYPSGNPTISTANVWLEGCGMPNYNSATAPTALSGGTIIQGPVSAIQGADHFTVRNLGVDTGSAWVNANNAGVATEGLGIFNNGQVVGASPVQSPTFENVACLGFSASAAVHCMIMENVNDGLMRNVRAVYDFHGVVLKGTNSTIDGLDARGQGGDAIIVKSDAYAPASYISISHFHVQYLATAGDTKGIIVQGVGAGVSNVTISDGTVLGAASWGIQVQGASVSTPLVGLNIANVTLDYLSASPSSNYCFQYVQYVEVVNISNLTCSNYWAGVNPNSPVSGFTNEFALTNSHFTNNANNALEAYGRWVVSNTSFVGIGGTALLSDASATLNYCNVYFASVGTNTGGAGTLPHCP